MSPWQALLVVAISAAPVVELRGGIPLALAQGFDPASSLLLALAGNLLVIPVLLWGLGWIERILLRWGWSSRALQWVFARSRRKSCWVERLGAVGLVLIVAVPLPGTGAWTGAIVARLLGLPNRRALVWIALGVTIAGAVVLAASLGAFRAFGLGPVD